MIHKTKAFTTGLILAALLALADLATLAVTDGETPPMEIAVGGAILGLITLAGLVPAWRDGRAGLWVVIVSRTLSALGSLPAFVASDVPAGAQIGVGVFIAITVATLILLAPGLRVAPARTAS